MVRKTLFFFFALFSVACVPITPEPIQEARNFDCEYHHVHILPGQSSEDPPSDNLPGYIDILGVDSSLDGETLTATFYLRELPEELTINRDEAPRSYMEYSWTVHIGIESSQAMDYELSAYHIARKGSNSQPLTLSFEDALDVSLWVVENVSEDGRTATTLPSSAKLTISHELNSLTVTGEVPGIKETSFLSFHAFDFTLNHDVGSDSASCLPAASASSIATPVPAPTDSFILNPTPTPAATSGDSLTAADLTMQVDINDFARMFSRFDDDKLPPQDYADLMIEVAYCYMSKNDEQDLADLNAEVSDGEWNAFRYFQLFVVLGAILTEEEQFPFDEPRHFNMLQTALSICED